MGDPFHLDFEQRPSLDKIINNTFVTFPDFDASPTKAWLFAREHDPKWKWHYEIAFGKRPFAELYDLNKDPDQIHNLASSPDYAVVKGRLHEQLMGTLHDVNDPRVTQVVPKFEHPPFAGEQ